MSPSTAPGASATLGGKLPVLFQPIVDVHGLCPLVVAAEAMVSLREESTSESASAAVDQARRLRPEIAADRAHVASALDTARALPSTFDLWLQVRAVTLSQDPEFLCFLGDAASTTNTRLTRLVIEIAEYTPEWADTGLTESLDALRHIDVRIAANEVGLGQADCRMILDCRPDYFKVDRYLVQGCHRDFYRRAVVESISMLAGKFGARVIAKGVEYPLDLETLRSRGVELAQGSIFGPDLEASQLLAFRPHRARGRRRVGSAGNWPASGKSTESRGTQ
jgi:EAL domain-containing protein (putative c-di-GMP-specific phosphodiesterase class I)